MTAPYRVQLQDTTVISDPAMFDCQRCGACCAYDAAWPRFSLESEADLARIPEGCVNEAGSGMKCENNRCVALAGDVGRHTACTVYEVRPEVCRSCQPGDDACLTARRYYGL